MKPLKDFFKGKKTKKASSGDQDDSVASTSIHGDSSEVAASTSAIPSQPIDSIKRKRRFRMPPVLRNFLVGVVFVTGSVMFFNAVEASKPGDALFPVEKELEEMQRVFHNEPVDQELCYIHK